MPNHLKAINDHSINYEVHGPEEGRTVILLHHGLGAVRSWKEQIPALAKAGYRVIAYDRWGHGNSDPRSNWSMPFFEEDLADLVKLLDRLGVNRAALIGHSDGGTIALYHAARFPERVTCLVIAAAHIYIETKMDGGIQGVLKEYEQNARFRQKLGKIHDGKAEAVLRGWYAGWRKPENLDWDMRPVISKISCPVLVVQCMEDEHASPDHARDIATAIPNAELWLVPGAGHMLPQDRPEEFNRRMLAFLEENL